MYQENNEFIYPYKSYGQEITLQEILPLCKGEVITKQV